MFRYLTGEKGSRYFSCLILIMMFLSSCVQHKPINHSGSVGINPELAAALQKVIDNAVNPEPLKSSKTKVIGISSAIIIPDQGIWRGTAGWNDPTTSSILREDMVFQLGSLTKNFTAALLLKELEKGQSYCNNKSGLDCLDCPVFSFIPGTVASNKNISKKATLRQALNMTSGIFSYTNDPNYTGDLGTNYDRFWDPLNIVTTMVGPQVFPPGEAGQWDYSNTNFVLGGMILQAFFNNYDLSPAFRTNFFTPYKLTETYMGGFESVNSPRANGWTDYTGNLQLDNMGSMPERAVLTSSWAAGSFISDADDAAQWIDALYGKKAVLSPDALKAMLTFVDVPSSQNNWWDGYGLGTMRMHVKTDKGEEELYGYGGNTFTFTSFAFYLPSRGASISFLINEGFTDSQRVTIAEELTNVLVDYLPPR